MSNSYMGCLTLKQNFAGLILYKNNLAVLFLMSIGNINQKVQKRQSEPGVNKVFLKKFPDLSYHKLDSRRQFSAVLFHNLS